MADLRVIVECPGGGDGATHEFMEDMAKDIELLMKSFGLEQCAILIFRNGWKRGGG